MSNNKTKSFANASKKITDEQGRQIPLSEDNKQQIQMALQRPDVRITATQTINDTSDEGHYKLVDAHGKILFEVLINPYTLRILRQDKIIARCHITPIRGEMYDEAEFSDKNAEDIAYTIITQYDKFYSNQRLATHKQR